MQKIREARLTDECSFALETAPRTTQRKETHTMTPTVQDHPLPTSYTALYIVQSCPYYSQQSNIALKPGAPIIHHNVSVSQLVLRE